MVHERQSCNLNVMAGKSKVTASFSRNDEPFLPICGYLVLCDIKCTGFRAKESLVSCANERGIAHQFVHSCLGDPWLCRGGTFNHWYSTHGLKPMISYVTARTPVECKRFLSDGYLFCTSTLLSPFTTGSQGLHMPFKEHQNRTLSVAEPPRPTVSMHVIEPPTTDHYRTPRINES